MLVEEKTRTINRIQKVLEDANIKLASVATDVMGVSGRSMIQRFIEGDTDPHKLADLAQKQLRGKIPKLEKALEGKIMDHHRFLLKMLWRELTQQEELIGDLDVKIEEHTRPFAREIERLDVIPGVDHRVAEVLLAEVGADMKPFPNDQHLSAWAGLCPSNEESATPGNRWLKKPWHRRPGRPVTPKTPTWSPNTIDTEEKTSSHCRGPFHADDFLSPDEIRSLVRGLGRRLLRPPRT